jgi:hypothetical protein
LKLLKCNRCKNVWKYKGTNPYCANCSRCKSTVFIKESSLPKLEYDSLTKEYGKEEEKKVIENPSSALKK